MKSKEQDYKMLKQKVNSIFPMMQEAINKSDGNNVQIGTIQITFEEANAMVTEFRKIIESVECEVVNKNVIPMRLLTTNYFFREIQDSLNRIN